MRNYSIQVLILIRAHADVSSVWRVQPKRRGKGRGILQPFADPMLIGGETQQNKEKPRNLENSKRRNNCM